MEAMRKVLMENLPERDVSMHMEGPGVLASVISKTHPDLVLLDAVYYQAEPALTALEHLIQNNPKMAVLQFCESMSSSCLVNAMHVGVSEVLPLPLDEKLLLASVLHLAQKMKKPEADAAKPDGKALAFIACKGGSGATFLATNLAYILAEKNAAKVALLDFNLQFGDAALFLSDQEPANSLADVAENIARLDASFLASSMVQVLPNLSLLAAPENPERAVNVRPEHIEVILRLAKTQFDFVIMDIGRELSAVSLKALDQADMIFPVLQETLPFIRDSKRLINTMQALGYSNDKIQPIVNRYEKNGQILLKDVEAAIGMKVYRTIPNSYENVITSVNQGIPIYKIDRRDPVTCALIEMANDFVAVPEDKKQSWFSRILNVAS
jgi:pilus assembly protein CpaE